MQIYGDEVRAGLGERIHFGGHGSRREREALWSRVFVVPAICREFVVPFPAQMNILE
ncbi:hypothetical protein RvVAR031_pl05770 (plasmid) [Agrobacterium vitis]|nr:hypothetical protein RvVAR031_pl05770 [Agrobacterium vitis]